MYEVNTKTKASNDLDIVRSTSENTNLTNTTSIYQMGNNVNLDVKCHMMLGHGNNRGTGVNKYITWDELVELFKVPKRQNISQSKLMELIKKRDTTESKDEKTKIKSIINGYKENVDWIMLAAFKTNIRREFISVYEDLTCQYNNPSCAETQKDIKSKIDGLMPGIQKARKLKNEKKVTKDEDRKKIINEELKTFTSEHLEENNVLNIISRNIVAIDIDDTNYPLEQVKSMIDGYTYIIHTTFSHTKENPRYRVFIPLSVDITDKEEYKTIVNNFVKKIGLYIDDCSKKLNQFMFLPNVCKDGEYKFEHNKGKPINPKDWLYTDETPFSKQETPFSKPKENIRSKKLKSNGRDKDWVIGAFCRAFTISEVLDTFLYDVYSKDSETVYTLIEGENSKGLKILDDDSLCQSYHTSDKIWDVDGKQCNSFDLICTHKFDNDLTGAVKWCATLEEVQNDKQFQKEKLLKENNEEELKKYICQIKKQGAEIDSDKDVNWIYFDDHNIVRINTGLLAEYLRNKLNYIFVRNDATQGVQRYVYHNGVYAIVNDDEFKCHIKKYIPLSIRKSAHVNEVLKELYTDNKFKNYNDINPENYINFKDGLLNIDTWQLEKHTSKVLSTIQLPLCYPKNLSTNNGVFDKYLDYLVMGNEEIKKLVLQFMGVVISNVQGHRMKKALFMVGTHNTGKSKIKELLIKLIGEQNANTLDLETLEARFGSSQILNKRLVGSNDMSYMKVKELKIFKMITGGDTIFMENKGQNGFNSKYQGIAWFCCNELPKFSGDKADGVYERFVIVKCNDKAIPENKQDKKLLERMFDEKEYILTLALKGLKEVLHNNYSYDVPKICKDELEKYKIDNDSFLKFLNECTEPRKQEDKFDNISKACVYRIYVEWCKDNNNGYKQNKNECQRLLEKLELGEVKMTCGIRYYNKFTLNQETKLDYGLEFITTH